MQRFDLQNCARFVLAFAVGWYCVEAEDNVVARFAVVVAKVGQRVAQAVFFTKSNV